MIAVTFFSENLQGASRNALILHRDCPGGGPQREGAVWQLRGPAVQLLEDGLNGRDGTNDAEQEADYGDAVGSDSSRRLF